jgi:hypothetical protein
MSCAPRPNRVVAYVMNQPPLEEHGFATIRSADATVELRSPRDPTVLTMSHQLPFTKGGTPRRYTDPLIAARDLRRSPGGDVDSTVDQTPGAGTPGNECGHKAISPKGEGLILLCLGGRADPSEHRMTMHADPRRAAIHEAAGQGRRGRAGGGT